MKLLLVMLMLMKVSGKFGSGTIVGSADLRASPEKLHLGPVVQSGSGAVLLEVPSQFGSSLMFFEEVQIHLGSPGPAHL